MFNTNRQSGYLLEVPLIMMAVGVFLAILLPLLPKDMGKIAIFIGVPVLIAGMYYMIVIPGWQPGDTHRLRYPWNVIVFVVIAGLLVFITMT